MKPVTKQKFICDVAKRHSIPDNEKILWSIHAVRKLRGEGLRRATVEVSLKSCELIEDYQTEGRPLPDCLVLGYVEKDPIHIVVAIDDEFDRILIVTVYRPLPERWGNDWKRRKKRL